MRVCVCVFFFGWRARCVWRFCVGGGLFFFFFPPPPPPPPAKPPPPPPPPFPDTHAHRHTHLHSPLSSLHPPRASLARALSAVSVIKTVLWLLIFATCAYNPSMFNSQVKSLTLPPVPFHANTAKRPWPLCLGTTIVCLASRSTPQAASSAPPGMPSRTRRARRNNACLSRLPVFERARVRMVRVNAPVPFLLGFALFFLIRLHG